MLINLLRLAWFSCFLQTVLSLFLNCSCCSVYRKTETLICRNPSGSHTSLKKSLITTQTQACCYIFFANSGLGVIFFSMFSTSPALKGHFLFTSIQLGPVLTNVRMVRGASKIKLKKVNKKRMAKVRRVIIFLNISRLPLLICLQCCFLQYKTLKAVATATAAIVLLTPAKNLKKVFLGFLVVPPCLIIF